LNPNRNKKKTHGGEEAEKEESAQKLQYSFSKKAPVRSKAWGPG